jgi:ribosome-associated protein
MPDENKIHICEELIIPLSELRFRFTTGSGPGGQHANRAATRVTLFFDIAQSPSLNEATRALLMQKLATRLDSEGVLRVEAQDSRSQWQNRETAVARFQVLLADALKRRKKRKETKPTQASKEKRVADKKKRGGLKQDRSKKWHDE